MILSKNATTQNHHLQINPCQLLYLSFFRVVDRLFLTKHYKLLLILVYFYDVLDGNTYYKHNLCNFLSKSTLPQVKSNRHQYLLSFHFVLLLPYRYQILTGTAENFAFNNKLAKLSGASSCFTPFLYSQMLLKYSSSVSDTNCTLGNNSAPLSRQ